MIYDLHLIRSKREAVHLLVSVSRPLMSQGAKHIEPYRPVLAQCCTGLILFFLNVSQLIFLPFRDLGCVP